MQTKLITAALAATMLLPVAAQAQTAELRRDRADIWQEQRDLNHARRYGDRDDVRDERRDLRNAREEYREDRRDYRQDQRHRAERFNAPFRYQRFQPGGRIAYGYTAPRYRVHDWQRYRLARPAPGLTYVRHYDDLLLVNSRTGRVVRVYNRFFW